MAKSVKSTVTVLSTKDWVEILLNKDITKKINISIFQGLYSFEGHKAPASQIGLLLGYTGEYTSSPINLEIGRYAKRIAEQYKITSQSSESLLKSDNTFPHPFVYGV